MAARRAGVSSMPLRPMSASPRAMDWSIDVKVMLTKLGVPAEPAGDQLGDFDVETDELVRMRGIRFDERRAAFRIAGPAEFAGRFRRLGAEGRQNQCRQCRQTGDSEWALGSDNIRT